MSYSSFCLLSSRSEERKNERTKANNNSFTPLESTRLDSSSSIRLHDDAQSIRNRNTQLNSTGTAAAVIVVVVYFERRKRRRRSNCHYHHRSTALSRYCRPLFFYHPTSTATTTSAAAAARAKRWFNIPLVGSLLASTARCKKEKKKKKT